MPDHTAAPADPMPVTDGLEKLRDALDLIDAAKARALQVIARAPYWTFVPNEEDATLDIKDGEAALTIRDAETDYGSTRLTRDYIRFPAHLLIMSADDFAAWQSDQDKAYREAQRLRGEAQERDEYERLRAKFETRR